MKFSLVTVDSGSDKDYQYNFIWLFKFVSDLDRCFLVGNQLPMTTIPWNIWLSIESTDEHTHTIIGSNAN